MPRGSARRTLARRGIVEHLGRDDSVEPDSTPMPAFLDEGT